MCHSVKTGIGAVLQRIQQSDQTNKQAEERERGAETLGVEGKKPGEQERGAKAQKPRSGRVETQGAEGAETRGVEEQLRSTTRLSMS